ncbi:MAG: UDP-N-acetylglucosamine 1-carboxyvinyltransferase [Candidatus Binatia bacterium]
MDIIEVRGGRRLQGEVSVAGAKNAALPILFATLLTDRPCTLRGLPDVVDVRTTLRLLEDLGARVERGADAVTIDAAGVHRHEASYDLVKTMRASFLVLGPLLARFGRARVSQPGGCAIGGRPVNLHVHGLRELGATIDLVHGYTEARAERLRGNRIHLDMPSVGATEHLLMVAAVAEGETTIENAACEPEVVDLAEALIAMGARISGAGESIIRIAGVTALGGLDYRIVPDRIEAGTFLMAAAITGGDVLVRNARADHLHAVIGKLREAGAEVSEEAPAGVRVRAAQRLRGVDFKTLPYPGFPTDLQAQMMAAMCVADGTSVISETIFENRFMHAQELIRLGADITLEGHNAVVRGVPQLSGAPVMATDLRASVSLILAGLAAQHTTELRRVYHLDRGYEHIEQKLSQLGADVRRVKGARG